MKRVYLLMLTLLLAIATLSACGEKEPELPKGVVAYRDHYYYVIDIGNKGVYDFATQNGPENTIVCTYFDEDGQSKSVGVKYISIEEGGWVAWREHSSLILYIPPEYPDEDIQWVVRNLADEQNSWMTFEDAKEYAPWLK